MALGSRPRPASRQGPSSSSKGAHCHERPHMCGSVLTRHLSLPGASCVSVACVHHPPPQPRAHGSWRGGLCDSPRHQKRQRRRGRKTGPRSQRHREARPGPQAARLCCSLGAGSSQAGPVLPRKALRRGGQPAGGQLQSQKVAVRGFHGPQPYCRGHLKTHSFPSLKVTGTVAPTFSPVPLRGHTLRRCPPPAWLQPACRGAHRGCLSSP